MNFWILELICIVLQFVGFIPFYLMWRNDCKEIGKDGLAISLGRRFIAWLVFFPIWAMPLLLLI
jgi:hypothetical protein